jgi:predicted AlkP superfamily phosphohydrolase/phosphomutase
VYTGEYSDEGPDLLLVPRNWEYMIYGDLNDEWLHPPRQRIADHHPLGVFYAAGQNVVTGEVTVDITDVAPTLLYLLDLPIPTGLDGEIVPELYSSEDSAPRPKCIEAVEHNRPNGTEEEADKRIVEERLDDLGYL